MIIFKHLFVISIPSKTLATSSQYVRKLAIFALLIEGRGITMSRRQDRTENDQHGFWTTPVFNSSHTLHLSHLSTHL